MSPRPSESHSTDGGRVSLGVGGGRGTFRFRALWEESVQLGP